MEEQAPSNRWNNQADRRFSNTTREILKTV
jgi:hypothetical protein